MDEIAEKYILEESKNKKRRMAYFYQEQYQGVSIWGYKAKDTIQ